MNDRRNSLPQDVLSFGPFSVFAAERPLKKADEPITLITPARSDDLLPIDKTEVHTK
jgi:hypothetical protein